MIESISADAEVLSTSRSLTSAEIVARERIVNWAHRGSALRQVAGVIIYDSSRDSILTYLRDDNVAISHPNTINFFGGMSEEGETPEQTVRREVSEELIVKATEKPYQIGHLEPLTVLQDQRGVEFHLFWTEADKLPALHLNGEGQEIIEIPRDDVLSDNLHASNGQPVEFSLDYIELARGFFRTHPKN